MSEKLIFQKDRLTVYDSKIVVGNATVFYSSVSATRIYEGRPLIGMAISGISVLVSIGFMTLWGSSMLGRYFPVRIIALGLLPILILIIIGFYYRVQCLFLDINGSSVAILNSKDRYDLEVAQRAIEDAKRTYESKKN